MGYRPLASSPAWTASSEICSIKFFRFVAINRHARFVHWKMRNATYGFAAIEHRYSVLGGGPIGIPEMQRFDLAWLLEEIYGSDYVEAPHFETLARLNKLPLAELSVGREGG